MQVTLLKNIVSAIAGQPAAGLVDFLHDKKNKDAEELFAEAFNLYSMFWLINGVGKAGSIKLNASESKMSKLSQLVKKVLDCCRE